MTTKRAKGIVRAMTEPWGEGEPCTCGHRWSEHADRTEYGRTLKCEGRCTVCTCNRFDWDVNSPSSVSHGDQP